MTGFITQASTAGFCFCAALAIALAGCSPDYSPNTYNGSAMQQANKVDTGIVVGYREVKISDDGSVGVVTGGAAGGILGAELSSPTVPTALAALGGTVVGGVVGSTIEHASGDTTGWEYIVREPKGDLVSVTQREPTPLPIGQKVLVIEGKQARIVPDYASAASDTPAAPKTEDKHDADKPAAQNNAAATAATTATPAPAAASASPAPSLPAASASPPAATPDSSANAAPTPLAADKAETPNQTGPSNTTPPAAPPPAGPASPPPSAVAPLPPASTGSGNAGPPVPPS